MIGLFFLALTVALSGAMVPGPLFAVTLQQALTVGWSAGFWLVCGHVIAELVLLAILRVGLGGILQRPMVTRAIGLVGGVVLLFFAWGMITVIFSGVVETPQLAHTVMRMSDAKLVGQGVILTIINPYWYLWWAAVGVGMIGVQVSKHGQRAWPVFFVGHSLGDMLWYVTVSLLIALSGKFLSPGDAP